ncbi:MAG TPA: AAA family ATPase [Thermomicrobiales bacterium]|nr:AAA family ATPase [Thermomicrobiales bacterium]
MARGTVIVLNGTSSAGKSSLARAIQDVMDEPYLVLAMDVFLEHFPERYLGDSGPDRVPTPVERAGIVWACTEPGGRGFRELEIGPWVKALWSGLSHAAAAARRGVNVVLDDVILDPAMRADYRAALSGVPTLMVRVCCPPDVLTAREQARGDRNAGMALAMLPLVDANAPPSDLTIDTNLVTPEEAAYAIKAALADRQRVPTDRGAGYEDPPGDRSLPAAAP